MPMHRCACVLMTVELDGLTQTTDLVVWARYNKFGGGVHVLYSLGWAPCGCARTRSCILGTSLSTSANSQSIRCWCPHAFSEAFWTPFLLTALWCSFTRERTVRHMSLHSPFMGPLHSAGSQVQAWQVAGGLVWFESHSDLKLLQYPLDGLPECTAESLLVSLCCHHLCQHWHRPEVLLGGGVGLIVVWGSHCLSAPSPPEPPLSSYWQHCLCQSIQLYNQ